MIEGGPKVLRGREWKTSKMIAEQKKKRKKGKGKKRKKRKKEKNHSTLDIIATFTNDISNSINNIELTTAVYIDLAKAFDTCMVNHEI